MHIFPQLRKLEQKYAAELVVIGVHSPKFPNEKYSDNVLLAAQRYELKHPIVNDAEFQVWQQYACRAWPTLMFVDPAGKVIGKHEGELPYDAFDDLLSRMIAEFDAKGMIDRRPLNLRPPAAPDTPLAFPGKVLADGPGNRLFIADTNHNRIVITDLDGAAQAVIGSGAEDFRDGSYAAAAFNHPQGMELVDGNTLYVADTENHAIRRVNLTARAVTTVAGAGAQGHDRRAAGPGPQIALNSPWDLAHHDGILYLAMAGSHQLWRLSLAPDPYDTVVQPHAGSGAENIDNGPLLTATLAQPSGIVLGKDRAGDPILYFADSETSSVRSAGLNPATGRVATLVGIDLFAFGDRDGVEHNVRLQHPIGIEWHQGALFVADTYNHKIKKLLPLTRAAQTLLGCGAAGHHDGPGKQATFSEPSGLSFATFDDGRFGDGSFADGRPPLLYIADTNNHAIRVANLQADTVTTLPLTGL